MKILIAIDGSAASKKSATSLIDHVSRFKERPELHLLHVHPPVPVGLATRHVGHDVLANYYREESEAQLVAARALFDAAELPYTLHIHVGEAAETIVKLAGDLDCDLIFMGNHGRGALPNAILGSVATKVLHLARVPVLLAK